MIKIFEAKLDEKVIEEARRKAVKKLGEEVTEEKVIFVPFAIVHYKTYGTIRKLCIESGLLYGSGEKLWIAAVRNSYLKRGINDFDPSRLKLGYQIIPDMAENCASILKKIVKIKEQTINELKNHKIKYVGLARKMGLRNLLFGLLPYKLITFPSKHEIEKHTNIVLVNAILEELAVSEKVTILKCIKPVYQPIIVFVGEENYLALSISGKAIIEDPIFNYIVRLLSIKGSYM